jgi:hypothetical protein
MKVRAVQYALHSLVERGEITVEVHGAPSPGRRQYRSNLYRLTGEVHSGAPLAAPSGADLCTSQPCLGE